MYKNLQSKERTNIHIDRCGQQGVHMQGDILWIPSFSRTHSAKTQCTEVSVTRPDSMYDFPAKRCGKIRVRLTARGICTNLFPQLSSSFLTDANLLRRKTDAVGQFKHMRDLRVQQRTIFSPLTILPPHVGAPHVIFELTAHTTGRTKTPIAEIVAFPRLIRCKKPNLVIGLGCT